MSSSVVAETVPSGSGSWLSHFKATLALGIPLIGAQLAQLGIHTTDMVIVGQLGAEKLAAMVLAGQFFFVVFIFIILIFILLLLLFLHLLLLVSR